jgi:hypothetical protein
MSIGTRESRGPEGHDTDNDLAWVGIVKQRQIGAGGHGDVRVTGLQCHSGDRKEKVSTQETDKSQNGEIDAFKEST